MEYRTITKEYGNCKATIHSPILTEEERNKRLEALKREVIKILIEAEKARA